MIALSHAAFAAAKVPTRTALVALIALTLAACSTGANTTSSDSDSLTVTDTWAKAADSGMTAAFGEITNSSKSDIVIVSASSPAATTVELHEVVDSTMRQIEGGFVIPAGKTLTLQPGGLHIMFMGLPAPIMAGDTVSVNLTLEDGSQLTFSAVAKDFAGGNESYEGEMDGDTMEHGDMSMEPSEGMDMGAGMDPGPEPTMSPVVGMEH